MKILPAIFCLVILAGCSSVTMKDPFPESKLTPEEQKQLTGIWRHDNSVMNVAFTSNGVPWMAGVDWKDEDFALEKFRLYFARRDDAMYACMPAEPGATNEYLFGEIKLAGSGINVWGPDAEYFARLVDNGILKGSVKKSEHTVEVTLETPAVEILELISTNRAAIDYKAPLFYQKLN